MGTWAAIGRPARSLPARCQTNVVLPAGSASFASAACGAPRRLAVPAVIAGPRRQAEPRAVLRCLTRAKHRGLLLVLADMRSIAAILLVLVGRSLATSGFLLSGRARTSCSDCLGSLRPSERRSVSQAWSRCCSGGLQGWSDWSGAAVNRRVSRRARAEPGRHLAVRSIASVGSVKPGLLLPGRRRSLATFPKPKRRAGSATTVRPREERSDERSMPVPAPKIVGQPEWLECTKNVRLPATQNACAGKRNGRRA